MLKEFFSKKNNLFKKKVIYFLRCTGRLYNWLLKVVKNSSGIEMTSLFQRLSSSAPKCNINLKKISP